MSALGYKRKSPPEASNEARDPNCAFAAYSFLAEENRARCRVLTGVALTIFVVFLKFGFLFEKQLLYCFALLWIDGEVQRSPEVLNILPQDKPLHGVLPRALRLHWPLS
jgi:hypothetical protein